MYNAKRKRRMAWMTIGLSVCVLACSMLYLDQQRQSGTVLVFHENEVLSLPLIEERHIEMPMNINAQKVMSYYESSKSEDELLQSVVEYEGVYRPSQSVCYSYNDKVFEVIAMYSGVVVDVYEDELMGKCVDVDHGSGLVVSYQSLSSTLLNAGDQVSQFDVIGLAGENRYYAQLGIHAQITAHLDGQLVDPESLIDRKVSEIK